MNEIEEKQRIVDEFIRTFIDLGFEVQNVTNLVSEGIGEESILYDIRNSENRVYSVAIPRVDRNTQTVEHFKEQMIFNREQAIESFETKRAPKYTNKKIIHLNKEELCVIQMLIDKGIDALINRMEKPYEEREKLIEYWNDLSMKFNLS